jgi:hypothetical protein
MDISIDPWKRKVTDEELESVLEKHGDAFVESMQSPRDLRDYDDAIALARLLVIPNSKQPIDHTRDLSLAAKKGYQANATRLADKQHQAARILADFHSFDWKNDVIAYEEERIGELGSD